MTLQLVIASPAEAAPANDDFGNAVTVGPILPFSDTRATGDATRAADDPSCAGIDGNTVWYRLSPSRAARVAVTTAGSNYDTTLSVYSGARGSLAQLGCNDDAVASGSKHSEVVFDAVPGTTYHVMAASYPETAGGTLVLSMTENGLPPATNDDFDSARVIATVPFTDAVSTSGATTAPDDPSCFGNGQSVWYRFTPTKSMRVVATTEGSGYDTTLSVFTGSRGSLSELACSDNIVGEVKQSLVDLIVQPGVTYHVMAASFSEGPGGDLVLNVQSPSAPSTTPAISVDDVSVVEGNGGTTTANFTVSLSAPSTTPVTVGYATANGTATAPADYVATAGTLTIPVGSVSATVPVPVQPDTVKETDEVFTLELSVPSGATIADGSGKATIVDDDGGLSVSDTAVAEGTPGGAPRFAVFAVSLSPPSANPVSVAYATANGTATAGSDYIATSGIINFAANEVSKTVTVAMIGEAAFEPDETFFVDLSNASSGTFIADARGQGTIWNDDNALSVSDVSVTEGATATVATFIITMAPAHPNAIVTVNYATADGTATAADGDYVPTSGSWTFTTGATQRFVSVVVKGDIKDEPNEAFFLRLSNSANALIADGEGQASVTDDDAPPVVALSINDVVVNEGNVLGPVAHLSVRLSHAVSDQAISVDYMTANGSATAPGDYTPVAGTLVFKPYTTTLTVSVPVNSDVADEPNEAFFVNLVNASTNASVADGQGRITIVDDDAPPAVSVSIDDASVFEGQSGVTLMSFSVRLSAPNSLPVSVEYATADGTATVADADYAPAAGTVVFNPGVTTRTVVIEVVGDTTPEPDEFLLVNLSNPANALITDSQAVGTILRDEA